MTPPAFHPALARILRYQMTASLRRHWNAFRACRNPLELLLLSALAVVWAGGVIAGVSLREPFEVDELRRLIACGMGLYLAFHVGKAAVKRPESDLAWSSAERQALVAGPFTRRELIGYQVSQIAVTSVVKALCVALVLIRDLPCRTAGFFALLLAFGFLDLMRTALQIAAHGAGRRSYLAFRGLVLLLAIGVVAGFAGNLAGVIDRTIAGGTPRASSGAALLGSIADAQIASLSRWCDAGFGAFGNLATVHTLWDWNTPQQFGLAGLLTAAACCVVVGVDGWFQRARRDPRQLATEPASAEAGLVVCAADSGDLVTTVNRPQPVRRLRRIARCGGIGTLFWRHLREARKHAGEMLLLGAIPAVLSLSPMLAPLSGEATMAFVVALWAFFAFLLLSATVRCDFRCDFERLTLLKTLPLPAHTVVAGQLSLPVLIATALQVATLCVVASLRPISAPVLQVMAAALLLLPCNVFAYSFENLVFLLSPHRRDQQGTAMFLRTSMVFTSKAVLLAGGLAVMLAWSHASRIATGILDRQFGLSIGPRFAFAAGAWAAVTLAAGVTYLMLVRCFADREVPAVA